MWKLGFCMDKNMVNLSYLLRNRGIICIDTTSKLPQDNCIVAMNSEKIFVTSDPKLFNEKICMKICCVSKKDSVT